MMEDREKVVSFSISQIVTEQFAIIPDTYIENKVIEIQHELNFGIDKENKRIFARIQARFKNKGSSPFLIISVVCHFSIKPDSWSLLIETDKLKIPKYFAIHLGMLAAGTLRGVLHAKTENTYFNRFLLPTIDMGTLVADDIIF